MRQREPDRAAAAADDDSDRALTREIEANRLQVLNRLVRDLAHEVKNPLNAVVINLELLKRRVQTGQGGDALEYADRVGGEVRRVHEIVDALFTLMRPEREPEPPISAERVLDELLALLRLQAKVARVEFDVRPANGATRVEIEPAALKHAVLDLVGDAFDAARPDSPDVPGDHIALRLRPRDDRTVELRLDGTRADPAASAAPEIVRRAGGRIEVVPEGPQTDRKAVLLLLPAARP